MKKHRENGFNPITLFYKNDEGERGNYVASCASTKPKACIKQIPVGQYIIQSKSNLKKFKKDTMIEIKEIIS